VADDERRKKTLTISDAAAGENQRDLLVALRTRIATALDNPNTLARDLASLSRRLHEITRDIEAIDSAAGEDGIGDAAGTPDDAFDAEAL
jgi:hypothetical protein